VGSILHPATGVGVPLLPDTLGGRIALNGIERDYDIDFHRILNDSKYIDKNPKTQQNATHKEVG
jgi:hypothetical protein